MASNTPPLLDTSNLFNNELFSDITIKSGDVEIRCHKLVLAQQSKYFKKMLDPERGFIDSKQVVIELKGDVPYAVEGMIRHLYTGMMCGPGTEHNHGWRFFFDIMQTAGKYLMSALAYEAFDKFSAKLMSETSAPQDIADAITAMRGPENALNMNKFALDVERAHFQGLLKVPGYFTASAGKRIRELEEYASKIDNSMVTLWRYTCNHCHFVQYDPDAGLEVQCWTEDHGPCNESPRLVRRRDQARLLAGYDEV